MLREGTDPSGPRGNHPTGAPRWVHSWLYRRNPPPPVPAASPAMIHPRRSPPPLPSVHRPFPRRPRLTATSFSLSVFPPPPPSPPRHCRRGCSSNSSSGGGSTTARDTHYPPLTNHLDHRLRIAECLVRAAGIPATEFLPLFGSDDRLDVCATRVRCKERIYVRSLVWVMVIYLRL